MTATDAAPDDFIAWLRHSWAQARPDLDTSPVEVLGRISRISALSLQQLDRVLAPSGVLRSEFDVLCALARSDRPLRASEVTAQTLLSSAATTKHAARLETAGLIERQRLERDGRVVLLTLTDAGRALVDTEFPRCLEHDRRLLEGLDAHEIATLGRLLQQVSRNAERHTALR